jgi:hypothetical protein
LLRGIVEAAICIAQAPPFRAFNLWALGRAAAAFGHSAFAAWCWRFALRCARVHDTQLNEARAHAELGLAALEKNRHVVGVGHITLAIGAFEKCGAGPERDATIHAWRTRNPDTFPGSARLEFAPLTMTMVEEAEVERSGVRASGPLVPETGGDRATTVGDGSEG